MICWDTERRDYLPHVNRLPRKNGVEVHFEIPRWTCPRGMREGAQPSGIYWWPSSHGSGRGEGSEVRMGSRKTEDQEVKEEGEWGRGNAEGQMGRERVAGGQDSCWHLHSQSYCELRQNLLFSVPQTKYHQNQGRAMTICGQKVHFLWLSSCLPVPSP